MDLPPELRTALDRLLADVPPSTLAPIAARQSDAYRHHADEGCPRLLVEGELDALAYAAWRMPATFGAATSALEELRRIAADFEPRSHLDLGAGPGTALLAAGAVFGGLPRRVAVEGSDAFREAGRCLFEALGDASSAAPEWRAADLAAPDALDVTLASEDDGFDLVTLCYVSGELAATARERLVAAAWAHTRGCFVMIEPGTTAGHGRILAARDQLLAAGGHVAGPCAHAAPCPIVAPDWCHFAVRIARSRAHRRVKGADLGYEDEKLAWLAVSRAPVTPARARLLRAPRVTKPSIELDVCAADGGAHRIAVPRRSKAAWKRAKKLRWGDAVRGEVLDAAQPASD